MAETGSLGLNNQDRLRFVGGTKDEVGKARRFLNEGHPLEGMMESEKTTEELLDVQEIQKLMGLWGKELGFDISR